jgi:ribosomal protein S18 acetylase RimI-like enzyme
MAKRPDKRPSSFVSNAPIAESGRRYVIRPMRLEEAAQVARYHCEEIPGGVLAELGTPVLRTLYRALAAGNHGFVFVAVDQDERLVGFISGVTDIGKMYRSVLLRHAIRFALLGVRYLLSPRMMRRIFATLLYPARTKGTLPNAELLSVVLAPEARGSGAGSTLLQRLLDEFRRRGVDQIRVMVGAHLKRANAYYRKHGFVPAGQVHRHGQPANVYITDTGGRCQA